MGKDLLLTIKENIGASNYSLNTEPDGNSTRTVIACDGDQFFSTEFEKTEHGFSLTIYGEWERAGLLEFLTKCKDIVEQEYVS